MKTIRLHLPIAAFLCAAAGLVVGFLALPLLSGGTPGASTQALAPFTDYRQEQPGTMRKITLADLPEPYRTQSSDNRAHIVPRPADAWPKALSGFTVTQYVTGLQNPRLVRRAPNGDLFVSESEPGRIRVLRGKGADGKAQTVEIFAAGLSQPFGIAFYPPGPDPRYVYVANTGSVVRFPYRNGDLKARGAAETIVPDIPSGGRLTGGGHWTRDLAFTLDGAKMFVSVGSHSNDDDADNNPQEYHRADIWSLTRMAAEAGFTPMAFATRWASRRIPPRANCGRRSTNATASATIWCRITSRMSSRAGFTGGHGSTWAAARIRASRANIRSCRAK